MRYDPISNGFTLHSAVTHLAELTDNDRLAHDCATANRVFDALRDACERELTEYRDEVSTLVRALPDVLSYRLFSLHGALLHEDRPDIDPRQPFWRSVLVRHHTQNPQLLSA